LISVLFGERCDNRFSDYLHLWPNEERVELNRLLRDTFIAGTDLDGEHAEIVAFFPFSNQRNLEKKRMFRNGQNACCFLVLMRSNYYPFGAVI